MREQRSREAFQVVFAMVVLLAIPAALTLKHVSRLGYMWSLSLFIVPIVALAWWFARRRDLQFPRAAFLRTIAVLAPLGFLLDLLFGNAFFLFPNKEATLGINVPAIGGAIPIEEFVFYLTGFIITLLSYIWCDEYWMSAYNVPDYKAAASGIPRIVGFHFPSLIVCVALIAGAIVYRKVFSGMPAGFPWYFIYLVSASFVPSIGFLKTAEPFINWRAVSFVFFFMLFISLLWEVTLALPYGWWEYRDQAMIGLHIRAWSGLPVEAPLVWMAVTFTTVIVYEVIKIWRALGSSALHAFFGNRS